MALFSASQMRAIDARQSPSRIHHRVQAELLEKLASESSRPTVSHVVFIGVVRAVEFALLVITGLLLFHLHVVDPVEQMAVYYPVTFAVSIMAVVVFSAAAAFLPVDTCLLTAEGALVLLLFAIGFGGAWRSGSSLPRCLMIGLLDVAVGILIVGIKEVHTFATH